MQETFINSDGVDRFVFRGPDLHEYLILVINKPTNTEEACTYKGTITTFPGDPECQCYSGHLLSGRQIGEQKKNLDQQIIINRVSYYE